MRCPHDAEFWQRYIEYGDPEADRHLQYCTSCRAEVDHAARVSETLAQLPLLDAPASVTMRFQALVQATTGREFTCAEALSVLEAWREGELDATQMLLMEEHLLWCDSCAEAVAQAEQLSTALHAIPVLMPPDVIAERLAAARIPWWRRMLQPVQPSWGRLAPAAAGFCAAAVLLLACILRAPVAPQVATIPKIALPPAIQSPLLNPPPRTAVPSTESLQIASRAIPSKSYNLTRDTAAGIDHRKASFPTKPGPFDGTTPRPPQNWGAGGLVPDMDAMQPAKPQSGAKKADAQPVPAPAEPDGYSGKDTIERQAQSLNLAMQEDTKFDTTDLYASVPARPATPPEVLTSKPTNTVELPKSDNANAEINKMFSAENRNRVSYTPPPVLCVPGEIHANNKADTNTVRLVNF